ncbi:unnamed protein product [Pylaiella littoralis]
MTSLTTEEREAAMDGQRAHMAAAMRWAQEEGKEQERLRQRSSVNHHAENHGGTTTNGDEEAGARRALPTGTRGVRTPLPRKEELTSDIVRRAKNIAHHSTSMALQPERIR